MTTLYSLSPNNCSLFNQKVCIQCLCMCMCWRVQGLKNKRWTDWSRVETFRFHWLQDQLYGQRALVLLSGHREVQTSNGARWRFIDFGHPLDLAALCSQQQQREDLQRGQYECEMLLCLGAICCDIISILLFFLSTKQLNTNVSFEDLLTLLQTIYADEKSQFSLAGAKPRATSIKQQQH